MASVFDSQFAASAFPGLMDLFGESITYISYAGVRRPITAIVDRSPPAVFDASGNAVMPTAVIQVYNSATLGISSKEVDIGKDQVEMLLKLGQTSTKRFSFMTMLSQSGGVTQLAVI